jgi:RNase P/RNase MRP subunit p29
MRTRQFLCFGLVISSSCLQLIRGQTLQTTEYVTMKDGRAYVAAGERGAYLERTLALTPELTVHTNGVIKIAGGGEEQLTESKRVTLDGFWITSDGTLQAFRPHYLMKAGVPYVVKSGELTKLEENVIFPNGNVLRLEGILASRTRLIRLQDGQRLGLTGEVIPALDHIMMANGKLVLQKDGSIIPLPVVSSMGMSEGTRVTGSGLITTTTGEQFALSDGQRLTVDGAAMLMSP